MGITARAVSVLTGLGTFTNFRRMFRYLGSQLARMIVPATTPPVEANAFESNLMVIFPSYLANFYTECSSTIRLGYMSASTLVVNSHNNKAVGTSLLTEYIIQETLSGASVAVGATT